MNLDIVGYDIPKNGFRMHLVVSVHIPSGILEFYLPSILCISHGSISINLDSENMPLPYFPLLSRLLPLDGCV